MTDTWTEDKQHTLEVNYPFMTAVELAEYMNESVYTIRYRVHKHGLSKGWTDGENEYLKRHYATDSIDTLVFELDRTANAIYQHAKSMGLEKDCLNRDTLWNEQDIEYLKSWYRHKTVYELAEDMNKTVASINYRVRTLGLTKVWTAEEDKYLKEHYEKDCASQLAIELDRTLGSIYARAYKLGVNK